jgi:ParB/RepB/Spo0J family partition protein
LNSVTVREITDPQTGAISYGLVDGLQRLTASKDAGKTHIPARILRCDEADILEAQIIANIHKIETKPAEYTKQLIRILAANPLMTVRDLAAKLSQSEAWVSQRLSINKLDEEIQQLVDADRIGLSNAYALAKLPPDEQKDFVDRAMTDTPSQFIPLIHARVKELRDASREGKDPKKSEFVATPHIRKMSEIKSEWENPGRMAQAVIATTGAADALSGFTAALAWVLNMDPDTVRARQAKDAERRAMKEAEAEKRKEERERRKQEEAARKAADLESL